MNIPSNIYEELKDEHEKVKVVLDKLVDAETAETRRKLVAEVRDLLVPHSRAEEAVFYNTLREIDETRDLVMHSYEEHLKAETLLRSLQVTESVALNWKSGVKKLKEEISHHIDEEEGKIFNAAKRVFSDEEAAELGKVFKDLKPKMGAGVFASNLELMMNLMPQRFRGSFARYIKKIEERTTKKAS